MHPGMQSFFLIAALWLMDIIWTEEQKRERERENDRLENGGVEAEIERERESDYID